MLRLDPSRPYQVDEHILALWLPRGRGRDAPAEGLVAAARFCGDQACRCTTAALRAVPVDDRAEEARLEGDRMRLTLWAQESESALLHGTVDLALDFATGIVTANDGGVLPASTARFFEEPLPYWVLDHFWALWSVPRIAALPDWKTQALRDWEPGFLLSTLEVYPEARLDAYVVEGREYLVDTLFCVTPDCPCTDGRLAVLEWRDDRREAIEVGDVILSADKMKPVFESDGISTATLAHIYLDWCRRSVSPAARFEELRALTRERGRELYDLLVAPGSVQSGAATDRPWVRVSGPRPGRNDLCACGSGRKYKRCCGMRR